MGVISCLVALLCGCGSTASHKAPPGAIPFKRGKANPPIVAVMDLDNQSNLQGQWNLGSGMANMLVTRLMATKKVVVLERQNMKDILGEFSLQQKGLSREEGRAVQGRLKNAKYLIRGSITDFDETGGTSGFLGISSYRVFGGGSRAVVSLHLRVYDVENGEILSSIKADGNVYAGSAGVAGRYKDIKFGGEAFKRTPLGKATEKAVASAMVQLLNALPIDYWHPQVAVAEGNVVVINGGENVGLKMGDQFIVREKSSVVTDPATGNVIDTIVGKPTGRVEVQKVSPLSSTAVLMEGTAVRGQPLEPEAK